MAAALLFKSFVMSSLEVKKPLCLEVKKERRLPKNEVFLAPAGAEEEA
jgi:hypothetical protein